MSWRFASPGRRSARTRRGGRPMRVGKRVRNAFCGAFDDGLRFGLAAGFVVWALLAFFWANLWQAFVIPLGIVMVICGVTEFFNTHTPVPGASNPHKLGSPEYYLYLQHQDEMNRRWREGRVVD